MTIIWIDWGDSDSAQLEQLWEGIANVTVLHITQWNHVTERAVELAISNEEDTLLFCGHGTGYGLLAPGSYSEYVLHEMNASSIRARNVIGISCHAAEFARRVGLHGFFSGMFISNMNEAIDYCVHAEDGDIESAIREILSQINRMLRGDITQEECLSTLQSTNTDNFVERFNIDNIEIL